MFRNIHNDSVEIAIESKEYLGHLWILIYIPSFLFLILLFILVKETRNSFRGKKDGK